MHLRGSFLEFLLKSCTRWSGRMLVGGKPNISASSSAPAAETGSGPLVNLRFMMVTSGSRGLLPGREKLRLFSVLPLRVSLRPAPRLHAGRGRIQLGTTAGPAWPFRRILKRSPQ